MSFLWLTIPATLALAVVLLVLVIRSVLHGDFDDPEAVALRAVDDDDRCPEAPESELRARRTDAG